MDRDNGIVDPRIRRLIDSPRRPGAIRLWSVLNGDEREAATRAFVEAEDDGRTRLNKVVAEGRRFRPATIQRWALDKIVIAMRTVPLHDPGLAHRLLHRSQVPGKLFLVSAILDALGIPHEEGQVDSVRKLDASEDSVRSTFDRMVEEYGHRAVVIYLLVQRLDGAPIGEKARGWLQELYEEGATDSVPEPGESVEATLQEVETAEEEGEAVEAESPGQASLTTLDRLLRKAAEDSAQEIVGALSEDELDDAVVEFVKLNSRRPQSFFHAGYRDVLFNRNIAAELPVEDPRRLRWYWTGAIRAWAKHERWDRIVREYDASPVVRQLGSGSNLASVASVLDVVDALHREGRTAEIAGFVEGRALVAEPHLFGQLLDAATELLRSRDAANAHRILDLLMSVRGRLEERGVAPPQRLLLDAHRRTAHCLRELHEYERARELLVGLLDEDPDLNVHAMAHADLGLMGGGFDSMEDVALPIREHELNDVLDRIAEGEDHFRQSVRAGTTYSAHGHYCLGVLTLGRADSEEEFEQAERHLQRARVHFSKRAGSYADDLVQRTNLYTAIAKTQQLQPDKLAHAARVIVGALGSGARFPIYLINHTVGAFELTEDKMDLGRVTEAIIANGDDLALNELARCDSALDHCPLLTEKLHDRARSGKQSSTARASDLRAARRGYMSAGDLAKTGEVLDELEHFALNRVAAPEFLELLSHPDRYDPAWTRDDATIARAHCHEACGELREATNVLRDLFYRLTARENEIALDDARGLLQKIAGYGIPPSLYSDMTDRYAAVAEQVLGGESANDGEPARPRLVKVLVVGGSEQQARSEEQVREALRERHPHVRVCFIQTGWSSNWDRPFVEFERQAPNHDALVTLRFMRTNLGRRVRRTWPGSRPWRFCWSGGTGAIVEAVAKAAAAVRQP